MSLDPTPPTSRGGGPRVGVFDAGIGGLPLARELVRTIPGVSICYLADSARRPYGPQPSSAVTGYVQQAEAFFAEQEVDIWVIACNTASVVAPPPRERLLPRVDMIDAIGRVLPSRADVPLALLGTQGTITSGVIPERYPDRRWVGIATERLLRFAEEGAAEAPELDGLLDELRGQLADANVEHALLACTDYTCVLAPMTAGLPGVTLLDPLDGAVRAVHDLLGPVSADPGSEHHELHDTGTHPVDIPRLADTAYGLIFSTVSRAELRNHA